MVAGADSELKCLNNRRNQERRDREASLNRPNPTKTPNPAQTPGNPSQSNHPAAIHTGSGFSLLQQLALTPVTQPATATTSALLKLPDLTRCNNCQEVGHWACDCPKPRRTIINEFEEDEPIDLGDEDDLDGQGKDPA